MGDYEKKFDPWSNFQIGFFIHSTYAVIAFFLVSLATKKDWKTIHRAVVLPASTLFVLIMFVELRLFETTTHIFLIHVATIIMSLITLAVLSYALSSVDKLFIFFRNKFLK